MSRYNPLPASGQFALGRGSRTTKGIRKAQRSYRRSTLRAGSKLQDTLWSWLTGYGLSIRGYTFMDQNTYVRQRMGSLEHHDDIPASELDHFISNMAFNAPLFILTSGESHDDMHSLLSETTDSVFFDKMRKTHFKNDPDYEDKLDVVRERLSSELDRVANKLGWWIGDEAAEMLTVTLKSGYPHHTYHVFPVFLRGTREAPGSGSLKTTIPWW